MFEYRVCEAEVSFCIFKVDWVYFVRHGRRSNFSFFCFLTEIFHGYVSPCIATKVYEDIVNPFHAIEVRGQVVVVFNLSGVLLSHNAEMIQKLIPEFLPVGFWKCDIMRVEIACCTSEFSAKWYTNE